MKDSIRNRLESVCERFEELEGLLADPKTISDQDKFRELSQEYSRVEPVVQLFQRYEALSGDIQEAEDMVSGDDAELREMGEANALNDRRRTPLRRATLMRACSLYCEKHSTREGRVRATFEIVTLTGWAPGPDQPRAKRPGSATHRLAEALGTTERAAGEKAGG